MRATSPALTTHRNRRASTHAEHLVWLTARNRTTGAAESIGLWTGSGPRQFATDGVLRTYHGTSVLRLPEIHGEAGVRVRRAELVLSGVSEAVEQAVRIYDTFNAPVLIHRAEFDADKSLIAPPERVFRGRIEKAPIHTAAYGDGCDVRLELVSDAWRLTTYPSVTKSDPAQQARSGDRGRRYSNAEGKLIWGEAAQQPKKRKKFLGIF